MIDRLSRLSKILFDTGWPCQLVASGLLILGQILKLFQKTLEFGEFCRIFSIIYLLWGSFLILVSLILLAIEQKLMEKKKKEDYINADL